MSSYGRAVKAKLSAIIHGEPEDQLRNPLERLLTDLVQLSALDPQRLTLVGETLISDLKTRPDFAARYADQLTGFIEIKAPARAPIPRRYKHDKEQWEKLQSLPNLAVHRRQLVQSLWRNRRARRLDRRVARATLKPRAKLAAPDSLNSSRFDNFLRWEPIPPKSRRGPRRIPARLCRLLRDEVTEQLAREARPSPPRRRLAEAPLSRSRQTHNSPTATRRPSPSAC